MCSCGSSQTQAPLVSMFAFILTILITALWAAGADAKSCGSVEQTLRLWVWSDKEVFNR